MIRLIASDVDGTLLPEGTSNLNPELFEVILQLKQAGVHFCAASGRGYRSVEDVFTPVAEDIAFIADNGAYATCSGQVLTTRPLPPELCGEIEAFMNSLAGSFILYSCPLQAYTSSTNEQMIEEISTGYHMDLTRIRSYRDITEPIIKMAVCCRTEDAGEVAKRAIPLFSDRLSVTASGKYWVDFMALAVSKGQALSLLQQHLGVSKEETMAFGDNNNDIAMLEQAGAAIVVANARAEAKAVAKEILPDEEDAVLHRLKSVLADLTARTSR